MTCSPSTTAIASLGPLLATMVAAAANAMPRPAKRLTTRRMSPVRRLLPVVLVSVMDVENLSYWAVRVILACHGSHRRQAVRSLHRCDVPHHEVAARVDQPPAVMAGRERPGCPSHSTTWVTPCRRRLSAETSPVAHSSSIGVSSTTTTTPSRSTDSAVLTSTSPGTARGSGSRKAGSPAQTGRRRGCHGSESTVGRAGRAHGVDHGIPLLRVDRPGGMPCPPPARGRAPMPPRAPRRPRRPRPRRCRPRVGPASRRRSRRARPCASTAGASMRCWSRTRASPGTCCSARHDSSPGPDAHHADRWPGRGGPSNATRQARAERIGWPGPATPPERQT